jgi:hypothetical protein
VVSRVMLPFRMFRIFRTSSWLALVLFCAAPQRANSKPTDGLSRLSQVDIATEGDEIQVRIVGSEVPNFTSFTQDDPARVVVDWAGSRLDGVAPEQVFKQGMIRRIAVEQFDAESERISRIALELSQPTTYHVESQGRAIVVRLVRRPDPLPLPPAVEATVRPEKPVEPKPEPELAAGPLTEPDLPVPSDAEAQTPKKEILLAKAFRPAPPPAPPVPSYKPPSPPPAMLPAPAMVVARADIQPAKPVTPLAPEPPRIAPTPALPVKPAPVATTVAAKAPERVAQPVAVLPVPAAPPKKSEPLPQLASVSPSTPARVPSAVAAESAKAPAPVKVAPTPVLAQAPIQEPTKPEVSKPAVAPVPVPVVSKPTVPAVPVVALAPRPVVSEPKSAVVPVVPAVAASTPVVLAAKPVVAEPKPSVLASKPAPTPVVLAKYEPKATPSPEPVATKAQEEVAPPAPPSLRIARLEAPPKAEPRQPPAYRLPQIASRVAVPASREPVDAQRGSWSPPTFVPPASSPSRPVARGVVRIENRKEDGFGGGQPVARASVDGKLEPVDSPSDAEESDPGPRTIKYVGFNQKDGVSRVFVRLDGKAKYRQFRQGDERVVVEFVNTAVNVKNNTRPLDTSYFETPLTSVQAVPTGDNTRLEITLRGPVTWEVKRIGTTLALDFRSAE